MKYVTLNFVFCNFLPQPAASNFSPIRIVSRKLDFRLRMINGFMDMYFGNGPHSEHSRKQRDNGLLHKTGSSATSRSQ